MFYFFQTTACRRRRSRRGDRSRRRRRERSRVEVRRMGGLLDLAWARRLGQSRVKLQTRYLTVEY